MDRAKYTKRLDALALKERGAAKLLTDSDAAAVAAWNAAYRSYVYLEGGTNAKGQLVWFCYATKKDRNGLWWSWREVHTKTIIHRYQMSSRKTKKAAVALTYRRQNAWVAK